MIATLVPNRTQPVILKPLTARQPVRHLHDEIDYLENEVKFYCHLLKMGILNGRKDKKQTLFTLLEGFSKFSDMHLPELRSSLNQEGASPEAKREAVLAAMEKMEYCNSTLKKLKSGVFPHVHQMQTFTIW